MKSINASARVLVLLGFVLVLLLSACGQDKSVAPAEDAPAEAASATDELRLGLTEWSIETGGVELLPGQVQVQVMNAGGTRHDVVIHGQEGTWATPVLEPGETYDMVITAVAGEELHLVCTLTGHESQGMNTRIDVVDGR